MGRIGGVGDDQRVGFRREVNIDYVSWNIIGNNDLRDAPEEEDPGSRKIRLTHARLGQAT